jgi:hypothetical protein
VLPTFIVIGARKSGTSSLWRYMQAHPDVFVPEEEKEPKYFVEERGWPLGRAWYERLFAGAREDQARGEFSTDYTVFPLYSGVPARMKALVPHARLIYIMRDPIEHLRSCYAYALWDGWESRPIREALLNDARYLYECQYALQIEQYLRHFDRSQMLLLTAENLRHHRHETLRRVFEFIDVDPNLVPANIESEFNRADGRRVPRPWARKVGDVLLRSGLADRVPQTVAQAIARVNRGPLFAREVMPEELAIDDDLRARVVAYLRPDLERLPGLVDEAFDCWRLVEAG